MTGIDLFLERFARRPGELASALGRVAKLVRLTDGEVLCSEGDAAECYWVVEDGIIVVQEGAKIVRRHSGDLVGEVAFYRLGERPRRSATMLSDGLSKVWEIDRAQIDGLSDHDRADWCEAIAAALSEKLIEATAQRRHLISEAVTLDHLLRRFVCRDGFSVVNGILATDAPEIVPDQTSALIWFSDVAGFSSFSKNLAPADAAKQIRRLMDIQVEEVSTAGGEIDKFMGDGLMAFWRLPDEIRAAERIEKAVAAAIRASERITALATEEGLPLDVRIGLHGGPVVIGDFGGSDRIAYTLIGETVNSASRFEQARECAEDRALGRVRISEFVHSHLTDGELLDKFESRMRSFTAKGGRSFNTYSSK